MAEIIKFDIENKDQLTNILRFIRDNYGYDCSVKVYCVLMNGRFGFITNYNGFCKLVLNGINGVEVFDFTLTQDNEVKTIYKDGYEIVYLDDGSVNYTNPVGNTMLLYYEDNADPNYDEYDGKVFFEQYNQHKDLKCDLTFPYMRHKEDSRGIMPIFEKQMDKLKEVYIDKMYSLKGANPVGFLGKYHHYFNRFTTYKGSLEHEVVLLKSKGFIDYIKSSVNNEGFEERFCSAKYMSKSGLIFSFFPYSSIYTEKQMVDYIESLGFDTYVPEFILNSYNGYDPIINGIHEIASEIRKVELENNEEFGLILSIYK